MVRCFMYLVQHHCAPMIFNGTSQSTKPIFSLISQFQSSSTLFWVSILGPFLPTYEYFISKNIWINGLFINIVSQNIFPFINDSPDFHFFLILAACSLQPRWQVWIHTLYICLKFKAQWARKQWLHVCYCASLVTDAWLKKSEIIINRLNYKFMINWIFFDKSKLFRIMADGSM